MNRLIVSAEGITRAYHNGVVALDNINLQIEKGEFLVILGPTGSGKTTLLNIIGGMDRPTTGKVFVDGTELSRVRNLSQFRAEKVGFVFQLHNLIPTLNAAENIQLPMCALKMASRKRKRRALELLEMVGLKNRVSHTPPMLSGGERQRVAIARALANNPCLVIGDEPTGTLDPETGREIIALMQDLNRTVGTTLVVTTHDPGVASKADRIVRLERGSISNYN